MQIISSLLSLQLYKENDPHIIDTLKKAKNRIKSIALIHEKLYRSEDFTKVDFEKYLKELVKTLSSSYSFESQDIEIEMNIDNIFLSMEQAIPCGLIINELITNSMKYAFEPESKGLITINFINNENIANLIISDNGRGMPKELDIENTQSLGLQIVNILTKQLDGTIKLENNNGTKIIITFPII